jgi:hypothetical protein
LFIVYSCHELWPSFKDKESVRKLTMKELQKIYATIVIIQISFIFSALIVSSMGIVIKHQTLVYVWYLALAGILSLIATSVLVGVVMLLSRIKTLTVQGSGSRKNNAWSSRTDRVRA